MDSITLHLYLRKRIFPSLHSIPNFKALGKDALNFLFYQIKKDYIDGEILRRPLLTLENA